jgi:hypothetical protein
VASVELDELGNGDDITTWHKRYTWREYGVGGRAVGARMSRSGAIGMPLYASRRRAAPFQYGFVVNLLVEVYHALSFNKEIRPNHGREDFSPRAHAF